MSLEEINDRLDKMGNAWEHFKSVNNERLRQIEKKGSADCLIQEELSKINDFLDEQKSKIEKIEVSMSRPSLESKSNNDSYENVEYKKALRNYLVKGVDAPLAALEQKADLTTATGSGTTYGGYLVSPNMQRIIAGEMDSTCFMRKICSVQNISSSALDIIDDTSFDASWGTETGSVSVSDSTVLNKITIPVCELIAQPQVTQKLLDDSSIDIEEWLAVQLAGKFAQKEEEAFLKGTGSTYNQPVGITTYTDSSIGITESQSGTDGGIDASDIVDLYYSLKEQYVNGACFVMPRTAVSAIRMLKDGTSGAYLWQPALLGGKEDTLMGCPVYQSANMPALGANSYSVIFGNFKFYQIVDRTDIRILRDPYTAKPHVRFYTTKRVGGDVIRKEAFKLLKCGAK